MPRTYTDAQRARALGLYRTEGPKEAARRTKIPESTIAGWARKLGVRTEVVARNQAGAEAARAKAERLRETLRLELMAKAVEVIERIGAEHVDFRVVSKGQGEGSEVVTVRYPRPTPTGVREYAVAVGVLLDKYRLEMGEATDRTWTEITLAQMSDEDLGRDLARLLRVVPTLDG